MLNRIANTCDGISVEAYGPDALKNGVVVETPNAHATLLFILTVAKLGIEIPSEKSDEEVKFIALDALLVIVKLRTFLTVTVG